ncbi:hypothetical protein BHM03_00027953 [Ensete ventricosum]|nr:hypothetical protein BHM03_00027953 [Ensete ventricosum]
MKGTLSAPYSRGKRRRGGRAGAYVSLCGSLAPTVSLSAVFFTTANRFFWPRRSAAAAVESRTHACDLLSRVHVSQNRRTFSCMPVFTLTASLHLSGRKAEELSVFPVALRWIETKKSKGKSNRSSDEAEHTESNYPSQVCSRALVVAQGRFLIPVLQSKPNKRSRQVGFSIPATVVKDASRSSKNELGQSYELSLDH